MSGNVLVAEIGSTTTIVNAFGGMGTDAPFFAGQGVAPTSVAAGDVRIGLDGAVEDLRGKLIGTAFHPQPMMLATSSAAGGLRMTVHGLVYDMTVRAGQEAALGAGANIHFVTAGVMREEDIARVEAIAPNLILLAGGTDYGERETALKNAAFLCASKVKAPVLYCGNVQNHDAVRKMFAAAGRVLYIAENVYPRLDELNVEPVRALIHEAFEAHITEAPGMDKVRQRVAGKIMPTPGAVMECAKLFHRERGDVMVVDVGGATTDIHSVTPGSEEYAHIQTIPQPLAKRTVEGDLGIFVNAKNLCEILGLDPELTLRDYPAVPTTQAHFALATDLARHAATIGMKRHAGRLRYTFGPGGRHTWADGRDLTRVKFLIATGGALTRLPGREAILENLRDMNADGTLLYPRPGTLRLLEDRHYILASLGVLSLEYPKEAAILLREALHKVEECTCTRD
ncbi:MAG: glutamate mutase L [Defluviitaleaceae bacterium]|nr:glutamate mutase L [Defluviitaleaceae bacterium]